MDSLVDVRCYDEDQFAIHGYGASEVILINENIRSMKIKKTSARGRALFASHFRFSEVEFEVKLDENIKQIVTYTLPINFKILSPKEYKFRFLKPRVSKKKNNSIFLFNQIFKQCLKYEEMVIKCSFDQDAVKEMETEDERAERLQLEKSLRNQSRESHREKLRRFAPFYARMGKPIHID